MLCNDIFNFIYWLPIEKFCEQRKIIYNYNSPENQEIWSIMIQKFECICTNPVWIGLLQHSEKNTKLEILVPATK